MAWDLRPSLERGGGEYLDVESAALELAVQQHRAGNLHQAAGLYREILDREPKHPDALYMLGLLEQQTGRAQQAVELVAQAVRFNSENPLYYFNLANALAVRGHLDQAIAHYRRCTTLDPDFAEAHFAIGNLLEKQERNNEALAAYEAGMACRSQSRTPGNQARNRVAALCLKLGRFEQAIEHWQTVARDLPNSPTPYLGMARAYERQGDRLQASMCYDQAMALSPLDEDARLVRSLLWLQAGDFANGWQGLEWRHRKALTLGSFRQKLWQGDSLDGKSIHICGSGKLAEQIMFLSCLPDMVDAPRQITMKCDRRLESLVQRTFPQVTLVPKSEENPAIAAADAVLPLVSLPRHLRPSLKSFPRRKQFLQACPSRLRHWRERLLLLGPDLKVGICFNGDGAKPHQNEQLPSVTEWEGLLRLPGIKVVNLQRGYGGGQLDEVCQKQNVRVQQWESALFPEGPHTADLESYAALIAALDLVITVPSTAAHLAGALGTPVWTILAPSTSWCWMLKGERMPWYPKMRLYRAEETNFPGESVRPSVDWSGVFHHLQMDLIRRSHKHSGIHQPLQLKPTTSCAAPPVPRSHTGVRHSQEVAAATDA